MKNILITGGAGFIGSHLVRYFVNNYPEYNIYNLDKLTYAGNLNNLTDIENKPNYTFLYGDICNFNKLKEIFKNYHFDSIIHLAAESHVDNSIADPFRFVKTNILGTINLLELFKDSKSKNQLFYHISTDEVFGSLNNYGLFSEKSRYQPNSPYSASKASSDHFVRAYAETYKINYIISNCSNNYGSFQFPEKLIPSFISKILNGQKLPVYGDGQNVRDWLHVKDHVRAIDMILHSGIINTSFNIGGSNEWKNINLVKLICKILDDKLNNSEGSSEKLIEFVKDRKGHDFRYAINSEKINNLIGWKCNYDFEEGISETIDWYINNEKWLADIDSGDYQIYNKSKINK